MLRFRYRMMPRKMASVEGLGSGPEGRIKRLRKLVTALVREERIENTYQQCDEVRGYVERLIHLAVRNGDKHKETMEMADFWLLEKDLIHKLFKVLAPRYQEYSTSLTRVWRLPTQYPGKGQEQGIIELKGNPWPSVQPKVRETKYTLSNVLLEQAKREYYFEKQASKQLAQKQSESAVSQKSERTSLTESSTENSCKQEQEVDSIPEGTKIVDLNNRPLGPS